MQGLIGEEVVVTVRENCAKNPHYVGDLVQGRETTMNVTNKTRKVNDRKKRLDITILGNAHEPINSRDVFEQVQMTTIQKAKRGERGSTRKRESTFLLISLIVLNAVNPCTIE